MYSWYNRVNISGSIQLTWEENISLAGCNNGIIADELSQILKATDNPPVGWKIPIADKWNKEDYSLIIDIKPKNMETIFLCELDTVFGFSCESGWTPIMLRLKGIFPDIAYGDFEEPFDKKNFIYPTNNGILYTILHLAGSFSNGQLTGTWNYPGPSSTNALIFWPEIMSFFYEQVKLNDPNFLTEKINLIDSWK